MRTYLKHISLLSLFIVAFVLKGAPPVIHAVSAPTNLDAVAQGNGILKWSNGGFLHSVFDGQAPSFFTLDREGRFVSSVTADLPAAAHVGFHDSDRASDGSIVFSGAAWSSEAQVASFIVWISPHGKTARIVSTSPYFAYSLAIAPDGSVWTLGLELVDHRAVHPSLNPADGVLRNYDSSGKVIGTFWPQSGFTSRDNLLRLTKGELRATSDRLFWYSYSTKGEGALREIRLADMSITDFAAPTSDSNGPIYGFAVTNSNDVAVSVPDRKAQDIPTYCLDRATATWAVLHAPGFNNKKGSPISPYVVGSDGSKLVFRTGDELAFLQLAP
jgi:hypothetical protein